MSPFVGNSKKDKSTLQYQKADQWLSVARIRGEGVGIG